MIILCITFLLVPADISTSINRTTVTDNVTDIVVAPTKTTVSTDSNIQVGILKKIFVFSC